MTEQEEKLAPLIEPALTWNPSITINDAIAAWRENGWGDLSPTTVRHYQELWDRHIRSGIGRRAISGVTGPHGIAKHFRSSKDAGVGPVPSSVSKHLSTLLKLGKSRE
ncbi:MAG: hypothetical protein ACYDHP_10415 [Ferrimicrobium sp.]